MAGDGSDSQECDQAKGDADACEGEGREAIEKGKAGSRGYIIDILVNHSNYDSRRHTQNLSFLSQTTTVSCLHNAIYVIVILAVNRPKYLSLLALFSTIQPT